MFPLPTSRLLSPSSSRSSAARHGALTEKLAYPFGNECAEVFQSEVAGIDQVQLHVRNISSVGLSSLNGEERIVLTPENQHSRLPLAEVLVPAVIKGDIRLIVV